MNQTAARDGARTATLRYGLIGCGDIGVVRAAALAQTQAKLIAVSDIDPKRATAIAARNDAVFDRDWRTLLARPDLDAVIISTPPSLHAEMCIEAVQMGKHVLCEKPLARSPDECHSMIEAAARHDRILGVGFNYRFYPSFALARRLLDEGRIGELSHIRAYAGYSATGHNQPWVKDASVVGGGALRDNGIHLIDLVRWFLGEVSDVQGFSTGKVWQYGHAEDNGFLLLRSPRGQVATVHASWTEWGRYEFRVELVGSLGKIVATCFPMRTELTWTDHVGGRARTRRHGFLGTMIGEHARSYRWVVARSFVREFQAFARAIAGEPPAFATGLDGLRAIEIASAATPLNGTSPGSAGAAEASGA